MSVDPPPTRLRVLVVFEAQLDGAALRADLAWGITQAGCELLAAMPAGIEVIDAVERLAPDLIIIDAESDWRDALEHVCMATRDAPRPIVLFTENTDTRHASVALAAGVNGYVVAGHAQERIRPVLEVAMARFTMEQSLRGELAASRGKLAARKTIERAKGLMMQRMGLGEEEAFTRLRRLAMDRKETLEQVANRVIEASRLLS